MLTVIKSLSVVIFMLALSLAIASPGFFTGLIAILATSMATITFKLPSHIDFTDSK